MFEDIEYEVPLHVIDVCGLSDTGVFLESNHWGIEVGSKELFRISQPNKQFEKYMTGRFQPVILVSTTRAFDESSAFSSWGLC